ncbi:hypothetical protein EJJ20_34820 [Pseudomonas poae]|nr:hypothetical protein EJJ20_34820 [Pseudomonas poae]
MCSGLEVTIYDGFKVAAPETPEPEPIPETTIEELAANALAARDQLLTVAAIRIAPLQDAVDLGLAIEADLVNLKSWKQYRVDLNRIRQQPNFPAEINWPPVPITDQSE